MLACLLLLVSGKLGAAPVQVQGIRIATELSTTRVALDLSRPVADHKVFTLSDPHRVVIDIRPGRVVRGAMPRAVQDGAIRRIRSANREDGSVRIVLDLDRPMKPRSFALAADGQRGNRLVVDLAPLGEQPVKRTQPRLQVDRHAGREIVVAIDAGHGGKDPGARGPSGVREKDVVLKISRRFKPRWRAYSFMMSA